VRESNRQKDENSKKKRLGSLAVGKLKIFDFSGEGNAGEKLE